MNKLMLERTAVVSIGTAMGLMVAYEFTTGEHHGKYRKNARTLILASIVTSGFANIIAETYLKD